MGEIMATFAESLGVAGLVIDGAIRDVGSIRARDFPVYARGVTHRGPYKNGPGEINVPVSVGGMVVHPGDLVVRRRGRGAGDPPGRGAPRVLEAAQQARASEEAEMPCARSPRAASTAPGSTPHERKMMAG